MFYCRDKRSRKLFIRGALEEDPDADLFFIYSLNTLVTDSSLGLLW